VILVSHDRALLRALCNRVWVLHDTRVTDFPGSFAEWEVASEEREHAARVAAEEEESLRRLQEKQKTRRRESEQEKARASSRETEREAKRRAEELEASVVQLEARVATLTRELEDPSLYTTPEGTARAVKLGKELDSAKRSLDEAMEAWTAAVERVG
jgi:ATP-binding cassette subfamily F protein 3